MVGSGGGWPLPPCSVTSLKALTGGVIGGTSGGAVAQKSFCELTQEPPGRSERKRTGPAEKCPGALGPTDGSGLGRDIKERCAEGRNRREVRLGKGYPRRCFSEESQR